jgi:hypothetical protein
MDVHQPTFSSELEQRVVFEVTMNAEDSQFSQSPNELFVCSHCGDSEGGPSGSSAMTDGPERTGDRDGHCSFCS